MSDRLEAVKAQFDAMIERMKEECYRRVDLEMEVLMEIWREEKRRKMKKTTRGRAVKRMRQDKAAEDGGGQESDDEEDSVSVKSEIESDECHCDSDGEDNSNFEVKEESSDEDGDNAAAPVPSTSHGRKRQATPERNVPAKKRRITPSVDAERQKSASGPGIYKVKVLSINCTVKDCQCTFRCVHQMREHLLAVHKVKPFPCRAQGCDQQFDKKGGLMSHGRTHSRHNTWICPHCPGKTFTTSSDISHHISRNHQTGQFQCTVDQCQFIATTSGKVLSHQLSIHSTAQHICPVNGCTKVFKIKHHLITHQRVHTSATPFHCTFLNCGYKAKERSVLVRHIRTVHFKLPATLNEQHRRGIVDDRNPNDFIEVDHEALHQP